MTTFFGLEIRVRECVCVSCKIYNIIERHFFLLRLVCENGRKRETTTKNPKREIFFLLVPNGFDSLLEWSQGQHVHISKSNIYAINFSAPLLYKIDPFVVGPLPLIWGEIIQILAKQLRFQTHKLLSSEIIAKLILFGMEKVNFV